MLSRAQSFVVIAIPLGLCLLLSNLILLRFLYRQHYRHRRSLEMDQVTISEYQKQLASFPQISNQKYWWKQYSKVGEVEEAYRAFTFAVVKYTDTWIIIGASESPITDSESRIEALLFTHPYVPIGKEGTNEDGTIFRNPHKYTAAEIKNFLEQVPTYKNFSRSDIAEHLITSIILPNVTLDGYSCISLLPFESDTLIGLNTLFTLVRGVDLNAQVTAHFRLFRMYCDDGSDIVKETRILYSKFFEDLFEPYHLSQPLLRSSRSRQDDFDHILDKAFEYGMIALSCDAYMEMRWGDRVDGSIMTRPALWVYWKNNQDEYETRQIVKDNITEQQDLAKAALLALSLEV